jgi:hypothetical protein
MAFLARSVRAMDNSGTKEVGVRRLVGALGIGLIGLAAQVGCHGDSYSSAPAPARVPGPYERRMDNTVDTTNPPVAREDLPPPPFNDVPLVSQEAPETARFVDAYNHVGRPRLLVWVTQRPGRGRYDEAAARDIDYAAMENILTDWLAAGGKVAVISPAAARQNLEAQQIQDLDSGQPARPLDLSDRLRADILVLVQAQPTRQTDGGPMLRLVADATNLKGSESIGRAVVDVPPPLDKPKINNYTRFVARKLMDGMASSWSQFGGAPPPPDLGNPPPPATQPAPPTGDQSR